MRAAKRSRKKRKVGAGNPREEQRRTTGVNALVCVEYSYVQWSLPIKDTLEVRLLSFIWWLSSGGRFESLQ